MKRFLAGAVAALALCVAWAALPYLLPTAIALGPCGKDWTSPTSWKPRVSPTESLTFAAGDVGAKVCYGSPSVRGRLIFGGLVPFGELWRLGANEPTRLFTDGPLDVAGIALPSGRYSLYAIPEPDEWQLFVTRSTFHWGNEIGPAVRARELGSATLPTRAIDEAVESMRFVWEPSGESGGVLAVEWAGTRVEVPVRARR
jgi:Protein of unknown function (DUF2911)